MQVGMVAAFLHVVILYCMPYRCGWVQMACRNLGGLGGACLPWSGEDLLPSTLKEGRGLGGAFILRGR